MNCSSDEASKKRAGRRVGAVGLLIAFAIWLQSPVTLAAATAIAGSPTTLESNSGFMVSFRQEEHMWQTSDKAIHVLINRGTEVAAGTSLRLFSSFDSGATWIPMAYLSKTGPTSTSDGVLSGGELNVVYSTLLGKILYSVLRYDPALKSWSIVKTETAFESVESSAANPSIIIDDQGAVWCAYVSASSTTGLTNIGMAQRATEESGWIDTGLTFGPTDFIPAERSARPVLTPDGIGMVYTTHTNFYWAYRLNGWAPEAEWINEIIFTSNPPYDKDPYESHFSVVSDAERNVHLALTDSGRLIYFRLPNWRPRWSWPKVLTLDVRATYPQITLAPGAISLFANALYSVAVFQSTDGGNNFEFAYLLTHDASDPDSGISFDRPRMETPSVAFDPIPVLQQYVDNDKQKMLFFEVPSTPQPQ